MLYNLMIRFFTTEPAISYPGRELNEPGYEVAEPRWNPVPFRLITDHGSWE